MQQSTDLAVSFSALLAKKGRYEAEDILLLENLLQKYPYSQPVQLMTAAILKEDKLRFDEYLPKVAAATPEREILYNIIHKSNAFWADLNLEAEELKTLNQAEIEVPGVLPETTEEPPVTDEPEDQVISASEGELQTDSVPEVEIPETQEEGETETGIETLVPEETIQDFNELEREVDLISSNKPEIDNEEVITVEPEVPEEVTAIAKNREYAEQVLEESFSSLTIEDYEIETVIPDFEVPRFFEEEHLEPTPELESLLEAERVPQVLPEPVEPEKEIFDSVASADYFVFDKSSVDPLKNKDVHTPAVSVPAMQVGGVEEPVRPETEEVSKYHDDKLPFTFLWWLQKTRKEHHINYQPYAAIKPNVRRQPEQGIPRQLDQQIIENIFSQQVPLEAPKEVQKPEVKKKEDDLIEKFIKEEPQIRPPKSEKLDTENKARKSSEDNLDLVSETLAQIYIDQMLYHKAIDTYKKLSLKYPEKSLYFAGQISELEKKIS